MNNIAEELQSTVLALQCIQDLLCDRVKHSQTPASMYNLLNIITEKQQQIVDQLQSHPN